MTYKGNHINLVSGSLEYNSNVLSVNYASDSQCTSADLGHMNKKINKKF